MDKNRVIGKKGKLPWLDELPADLKYFAELTRNKPVIMGRKTWDSLPLDYKPLPHRFNIVLTRDDKFDENGCVVVHNVEDAIFEAKKYRGEIMIIGGMNIYEQFMPHAHKMYLTFIQHSFGAGDAYFPKFDWDEWHVKEDKRYSDLENKYDYTFIELERKQKPS